MILREILVKLGLDIDAQSFAKGQAAVEIVKASLNKLVDFGKEMIEKVNEVSEYGTKIKEMSQSTGLATDTLQRLAKAAGAEGIGLDELGHSVILLSKNMSAAKDASSETGKAFSGIGVHVKDVHGKMRGADSVIGDIAERFKKMPDGVEKTALALKFFGRSGAEMIPLLNEGREGLDKFKDAAVMSPEQLSASKEIVQIQRQLTAQTKSLWREAIGPLLPAIRDLLKQYLAWKKANGEIMKQRIRQWIGYAITGIKMLGSVFKFLVDNMTLVQIVLGAMLVRLALYNTASIATALKTAWAWGLAALPFIAIGAAIAALFLVFDDLRVYAKGGDSLFGRFEKQIKEWARSDHDDPWWLKAIKGLVNFLTLAIDMIHEFNELFDDEAHAKAIKAVGERAGMSKGQMQAQIDAGNLRAARANIAAGQPLSDNAKMSLKRAGLNEQSFVQKYSQTAPGGGGENGMTIVKAPVNMSIVAAPGQSTEDLAKAVDDQLQSHYEEAAATATSVP